MRYTHFKTFLFLWLSLIVSAPHALGYDQPGLEEVIGYSEHNYQGERVVFKLPMDYRHKIIRVIPTSSQRIKSLHANSLVAVIGFPGKNLEGVPNKIGYKHRVPELGGKHGISSMIIYPKEPADGSLFLEGNFPHGALIGGITDEKPGWGEGIVYSWQSRFFPLPEGKKVPYVCLADDLFSKIPMHQVEVFGPMTRVTLFSNPDCTGLNIALNNPGQGRSTKHDARKPPIDGMKKRVKSVKVEEIFIPIPAPPEIKIVEGVTIIEPQYPQIGGMWQSNINLSFQIAQFENDKSRGKMRTVPPQTPESDLTISGDTITATYFDPNSGKQEIVKGTVTKKMNDGYAYYIKWDNTIELFRTVKADTTPKDKIPSDEIHAKPPALSGTWKSTIGSNYTITHSGNTFSWTVSNSAEIGQGMIQGKDIQASWKGPAGQGKATGNVTKVNNQGEATEIVWDNGVKFNR